MAAVTLTQKQRSQLENCLRNEIDQLEKYAETAHDNGWHQINENINRQQIEAVELLELLISADSIVLTRET